MHNSVLMSIVHLILDDVFYENVRPYLYHGERVFVDGRSISSTLCPECAHVVKLTTVFRRSL
jgi:hypothetical protein